MIITRRELFNLKGHKIVDYHLDNELFDDNIYLRELKNVDARIDISYNPLDELTAHLEISGDMICPCAITLEDVEVPFNISEDTELVFEEKEDAYLVENQLDIKDFILAFILPEVPIKVVKNGKIEYPRGDGWRVMTEETYRRLKEEEIDPRLAKLKEYKFDEEE